MIPDYYQILNVDRNASLNDIKKSYRKLALEWHPDRNKSDDAHEMFIKINQAYLILSDEEARQKYNVEYDLIYQKKKEVFSEQFSSGTNYKDYYSGSETVFNDPDLNNWNRAAKNQAEEYSRMTFDEFAKLIKEIVIEVGSQFLSAFLYALSGIIGVSGIANLFIGLRYLDYRQLILSVVLLIVAVILFRFIPKKY